MRYLEDIEVGSRQAFGPYEVTREEVIDFATKFDPQPFHLDDAAAAKTYFGRLSASGWHTAAMTMRMMVDGWSAGEATASLGSPGVDELRWVKPVYPGDTLTAEGECIEVTPSRSRPDMGSVKNIITVRNQHGETVLTMRSIGLVRRRPAGA